MTEKSAKFLSDMFLAIQRIESFTSGIKDFNTYQTDYKTQSAVERQLAILGEALNQYRKLTSGLTENDQKIVSLRNRLVHSYDSIDNAIIWTVIQKHLPVLKKEITNAQN